MVLFLLLMRYIRTQEARKLDKNSQPEPENCDCIHSALLRIKIRRSNAGGTSSCISSWVTLTLLV